VSSSAEGRDGTITSSSSSSAGSLLSTTTLTKGPDGVLGMAAPIIQSGTIQLGKTNMMAGLYGPKMTFSVDDTGSLGSGGLLGGMTRTRKVTINGHQWSTSYDPAARQITTTGPALQNNIGPLSVITTLDDKGRPLTVKTPWASDVSVAYDGNGRLSTISQGISQGGRQAATDWDTHGFLTSFTPNNKDSSKHTTTLDSDGVGRVRQVKPPGLQPVKMTPDASGNLVSLTLPNQAGQAVHTFGYDDVDRPTTHTPPLVGTTDTSLYTADGLPGKTTLLSGRTITPTYGDSKQRLTQLDFVLAPLPTAQLKLAYDDSATGLLSSLTLGSEVLKFVYNGALLTDVTTTGTTASALHFVFTDDLRVDNYTLGTDKVSFVYDNDGLPLSATTGTTTLSRTRGSNGLVNQVTLGSLKEVPAVDATYGEISGSSSAFGAVPLYTYPIEKRDSQGRELIRSEGIPAVGLLTSTSSRVRYGYDPAGRLTQRFTCGPMASDPDCTASPTPTATWSFDDNGNRLAAGVASFAYDLQDRLLSQGAISYEHDADGHLTKVHKSALTDTTYSYDVLGRLTQVQLASPPATVSFVLDPLGRRVQRTAGTTTQRWVYLDALRPAAEYNGSGALVSRFVYLSGRNVPDVVIKGGTAYRLLTDERGSVRLVVSSTGAVAQRIDYDEWGVATDSNPGFQPFGFAGGMQDPTTGLVHFGARDYSPQLGRWITKDPIAFHGGMNVYAYAGSDPVNRIDPRGLAGTLTVYSEYMTLGGYPHAWLEYTPDGGLPTQYGTYPGQDFPSGLFWGGGIKNYDEPEKANASTSVRLDDDGEKRLLNFLADPDNNEWNLLTNNCGGFALRGLEQATGSKYPCSAWPGTLADCAAQGGIPWSTKGPLGLY
jgi:RHS repeat-associated protein